MNKRISDLEMALVLAVHRPRTIQQRKLIEQHLERARRLRVVRLKRLFKHRNVRRPTNVLPFVMQGE